jgi:hypothetical protein
MMTAKQISATGWSFSAPITDNTSPSSDATMEAVSLLLGLRNSSPPSPGVVHGGKLLWSLSVGHPLGLEPIQIQDDTNTIASSASILSGDRFASAANSSVRVIKRPATKKISASTKTRMHPAKASGKAISSHNPSAPTNKRKALIDVNGLISSNEKKTAAEERREKLENDKWVSGLIRKNGRCMVECKGCKKRLMLENRGDWYLGFWTKHRDNTPCKELALLKANAANGI